MTSCEKCKEMLAEYIDGMLSPEDAAFLEGHIGQCEECARELTEMREMLEELKDLGDVPVPEEAHESWVQAVRSETRGKDKKRRNLRPWLRGFSYAAAAAALLFVGSLLGSTPEVNYAPAESKRDAETFTLPSDLPQTGANVLDSMPDALSPEAIEETGLYSAETGLYSADTVAEDESEETALQDNDYSEELQSRSMEDADGGSGGGGGMSPAEGAEATKHEAKIIREAYLYFLCPDFATATETLKKSTEQSGGYVEYSTEAGFEEQHNRYGEYNLRIPAEKLDDFLASIAGIGTKKQENLGSQDVSESYYDTKTRLNTLRIQYERLEEMLAQAEKVAAMIQIEDKMAEVLYNIESLEAALRNIDSQVAYSQVYIQLTEKIPVQEPVITEESFGDRIMRAFYQGLNNLQKNAQGLLIHVVRLAPTLIVILPLGIIAIIIIKKAFNKKTKKEEKNHDEDAKP